MPDYFYNLPEDLQYSINQINKTREQQDLAAVEKDWQAIKFIKDPSEAVQIAAVNSNEKALLYVNGPSVQIAAVNSNEKALLYVNGPSEAVQLSAVKQFPDAIRYLRGDGVPSQAVQLAAVSTNGYSIKHIKNPNKFIQKVAIEQVSSTIHAP